MKIAKIETVTYDPATKILSVSGVNRFSKKRNNAVFIEDEAKFLEIVHHLLASSETSSVNYVDGIQPDTKKKKAKKAQKPEVQTPDDAD